MSEHYREKASTSGDPVVYVRIEAMGHGEVIDPALEAWPILAGHLDRLLSA
jgi:hypothetical protein